jgi:non-ribosomal peptide synthetase component F
MISDGWSLGVLVQELNIVYDAFASGAPSPLPALPIQYADFAYWQRQWRQNAMMEAQLAYWQQQLRPPLPALELPTDHARRRANSLHTARQHVVFPSALCEALTRFASQQHSTLFTALVAAFKMLLYSYTGQHDLRVATFSANRHRWETEGLIGLVANTVILRTDLSGDPTCEEVLHRVQATTLAAYTHQDFPFEELAQTLEREQGIERQELCQVMFLFQNALQRPVQSPACTLSFLELDEGPVMPDLALTALDIILVLRDRPQGQGLAGTCIYKTARFEAITIRQLLEDFQAVLKRCIAQPEQPLSALRATWSRRDLEEA